MDADEPTVGKDSVHIPVLAGEVLEQLDAQPGQYVVDATLGGGGHTRLLAQRVGPAGRVLAIDRDPAAVERAGKSFASQPVRCVQATFSQLPRVLADEQVDRVDRVLMDLGLSSDQLADPTRGFSFRSPAPLDLRFDPAHGEPAWRLLERADERSLADLIFRFGEERWSRRIARQIVQQRQVQPIRTAQQLADLIYRAIPARARHRTRIDPATRTFQALRIAVNDELGELARALELLPELMRPEGRLVVISFHSLEDRLVKQTFRDDPRWDPLTRKPIRPGADEVAGNPRARSARLRAARRLPSTA